MRRILIACLLLLVPTVAGAAERGWHEASSRHFVVYGEGKAEDVRELAIKLERFDEILRKRRNLPDPDPGLSNRLTVFQVRNTSKIEKLAGRSDIGGFYAGRASGSIAVVPRQIGDGGRYDMSADAVLFHEYAHHFMLNNWSGAFPAWFTEGFAEFHATVRFEKDGSVSLGQPAYYRGYGLLMGNPLPLEAMLTGQYDRLTGLQMDALYGRGWLLVHYLTFTPSRAGQLDKYLVALSEGKSALDAARLAFGDLRQLDRDLDKYLRQSRLTYLQIRSGQLSTPKVDVRALTPAESAIMPLRIQSKSGVDAKEARQVVADARKVAARYPDDPLVNVTLAEAEFDVKEWARAEAAAERVLAKDPRHVEALIYKGRARMELAAASGADAATWKAIRSLFTAANKVDTEDPEPLILFYQSYARQGIKPTKNAVDGLYYAFALAQQDMGLRLNVARQMLVDGNGKAARATLAPVAYSPHRNAMSTFASLVIAKIDQAGPAAALAMMDGGPASSQQAAGS